MLTDFGVSAWPIVLADQGLGYRNTMACSRWQWDGDHGLSSCNFEECHWNCAGNLDLIQAVVQQATGHWVWGEKLRKISQCPWASISPMMVTITAASQSCELYGKYVSYIKPCNVSRYLLLCIFLYGLLWILPQRTMSSSIGFKRTVNTIIVIWKFK